MLFSLGYLFIWLFNVMHITIYFSGRRHLETTFQVAQVTVSWRVLAHARVRMCVRGKSGVLQYTLEIDCKAISDLVHLAMPDLYHFNISTSDITPTNLSVLLLALSIISGEC